MLVNYYIFKQLSHLCITFDIDVNWGESDMKNILCSSIMKKVKHDCLRKMKQDLIDKEDIPP